MLKFKCKGIIFTSAILLSAIMWTGCPKVDDPIDEPEPQPVTVDYDSYVLSTGAQGNVPAWTKSDSTYNLPALNLHGEASNITPELLAALADVKTKDNYFKKPKNFIVCIGDGMGVSHILAARTHRGELLMDKLPYRAISNSFVRGNNDLTGEVTDSAAGGTKIGTGYKTTKLFAAIDGEGNELQSLSELARSKGKKVGVVTNAELPDATPAVFSAHTKNRSQGWNKICDMEVLFGADLFMGGTDSSLTSSLGSCKPVSGKQITTYTSLADIIAAIDSNPDGLMWNLFSNGDTKYGRWNYTSSKKAPSLQQQMAVALTRLQKTSGDEGFFLMFENTYTDIYGHANSDFMKTTKESSNVVGIVNEVKDFDETIAIALKFVLENPDTVLLVVADHETGDMKFKSRWETSALTDGRISADSGSHSNQNLPVFAIGYGLESLDTLKGRAFTKEDCTITDGVIGNEVCGQLMGSLMNDKENSFGGDIETDRRGRTKDTFRMTSKAVAPKFEFTVNESTLPIRSGELIQFKIKPYDENANITVTDDSGNVLLDKLNFLANKENAVVADSKGNVSTVLSKAYKHAFNTKTDVMDGWYEVSVKTTAATSKLNFTIGSDTTVAEGSVVDFYDFTVQYASTKNYVTISGDNVTTTSFDID